MNILSRKLIPQIDCVYVELNHITVSFDGMNKDFLLTIII